MRLTFLSPSSLVAHLPQATLTIGSMSQLSQLLFDEVGSCLLERIRDVAAETCEGVHGGTWFVDLLTSRTIGRWEGRALYVCSLGSFVLRALILMMAVRELRNFHVAFAHDSSVVCTATWLERGERHPVTHVEAYTPAGARGPSLLDWVRQKVDKALESSSKE